jgi:phosphatidylglycerophosphatase A
MEKRLSGGVGVVMDDVGAGIYAHILVRLLALVVPS